VSGRWTTPRTIPRLGVGKGMDNTYTHFSLKCWGTEDILVLVSGNFHVRILCNFRRTFTVNPAAVPLQFSTVANRLLWLFERNVGLLYQ
jgi:hypothetical protein